REGDAAGLAQRRLERLGLGLVRRPRAARRPPGPHLGQVGRLADQQLNRQAPLLAGAHPKRGAGGGGVVPRELRREAAGEAPGPAVLSMVEEAQQAVVPRRRLGRAEALVEQAADGEHVLEIGGEPELQLARGRLVAPVPEPELVYQRGGGSLDG